MGYHKGHSDNVADEAVSATDREWKYMANLALKIREGRRINPLWEEEQRKRFTGIYKRLLTDPINEVQREAR